MPQDLINENDPANIFESKSSIFGIYPCDFYYEYEENDKYNFQYSKRDKNLPSYNNDLTKHEVSSKSNDKNYIKNNFFNFNELHSNDIRHNFTSQKYEIREIHRTHQDMTAISTLHEPIVFDSKFSLIPQDSAYNINNKDNKYGDIMRKFDIISELKKIWGHIDSKNINELLFLDLRDLENLYKIFILSETLKEAVTNYKPDHYNCYGSESYIYKLKGNTVLIFTVKSMYVAENELIYKLISVLDYSYALIINDYNDSKYQDFINFRDELLWDRILNGE